jgi:DNA-directed RNA polymerase specialized sigma24 family protein
VSTRFRAREGSPGAATGRLAKPLDPAEPVALVASAKREVLLRVHRHRLRPEDLEDCYGQATLELIVLARRGRAFASRLHIAHALEQRFLARVLDRRRAIAGRSPIAAAIEGAVPFAAEGEWLELPDTRQEPERLTIAREDLARVLGHMGSLTPDQRIVLATQIALAMRCEEFCRRHGWTPEKYRKVAQRARAKLRELLAAEDAPEGSVPLTADESEQTAGTT